MPKLAQDNYPTVPAEKYIQDTVPTDSGSFTIPDTGAPDSDSLYMGALGKNNIKSPAVPAFGGLPAADEIMLDGSDDEIAAPATNPTPKGRISVEEITRQAIASRVAYASNPPEMAAESSRGDLTAPPGDNSSTFIDELEPANQTKPV